jgi:hypothetical protein
MQMLWRLVVWTLLVRVDAQSIEDTQADHCYLIQKRPTKPRYLKFCQDYNDKACCIPGHDLEDQIQFEFYFR